MGLNNQHHGLTDLARTHTHTHLRLLVCAHLGKRRERNKLLKGNECYTSFQIYW